MKILLPYDGSAHSEAALDFVSTMAALRELTTRVTLIFVPPATPRIGAVKARKSISQVRADASRRVLAPAVRALRAAGLAVKAVHRVGDPAQCIVRRAATDGADLIVMGTHGRTARLGVLLGSVTSAVLADCKVPLLLLRRTRSAPHRSMKVALAYDDSADSRAALEFVIARRGLLGPGITLQLVHVVDEVPFQVRTALLNLASTEFSHEKVRALLAEAFDAAVAPARRKLLQAGISTTEQRLVGSNPGDALADYVRTAAIDLLVMGCRGKTRLQRMLLGSVTARVGARSDVPLLLVRAP
jgi:nucleotide-binding universal stress UspA family protein